MQIGNTCRCHCHCRLHAPSLMPSSMFVPWHCHNILQPALTVPRFTSYQAKCIFIMWIGGHTKSKGVNKYRSQSLACFMTFMRDSTKAQ